MTKVLWADFKSDLSDTRQHWHISFRYGWYISKCYRWYISFRYDWHNSFRCRWHIDSVAITSRIFSRVTGTLRQTNSNQHPTDTERIQPASN